MPWFRIDRFGYVWDHRSPNVLGWWQGRKSDADDALTLALVTCLIGMRDRSILPH
jgi:hypothetical protein